LGSRAREDHIRH